MFALIINGIILCIYGYLFKIYHNSHLMSEIKLNIELKYIWTIFFAFLKILLKTLFLRYNWTGMIFIDKLSDKLIFVKHIIIFLALVSYLIYFDWVQKVGTKIKR